ncbi:MAG: ankyrin repeat domain-containing protein [Treponema sp.]|nr:ankyrin repeat domain-containing protein [Treponema sp.]
MKSIFFLTLVSLTLFSCEKRHESLEKTTHLYLSARSERRERAARSELENLTTENIEEFFIATWFKTNQYNEKENNRGVIEIYNDFVLSEFVSFENFSRLRYGTNTEAFQRNTHWRNIRWARVISVPANSGGNEKFLLHLRESVNSYEEISIHEEEIEWEIEVINANHIIIKTPEWTNEFSRGYTVLMGIINDGNLENLKFYLQQDGNINERMTFNYTPLMYAIERNKEEIALFLIEHGADLSLQSSAGLTPLHFAVKHSAYESNIIQSILMRNANVNLRDKYNQTVMDLTIRDRPNNNFRQIQYLLSEYGAVSSRNEWQDEVNASRNLIEMNRTSHSSDIILEPIMEQEK